MVDEGGSGSQKMKSLANNAPTSLKAMGLAHVPAGQEGTSPPAIGKDGTGGTDALLRPIAGLRQDNVDEIRQLFKMPPTMPKSKVQDASRTFQPIKNLDLGALQQQEELKEVERHHPKSKFKILQTHRAFSDLHDEDHHEKLQ
jgi:hypothetical protein